MMFDTEQYTLIPYEYHSTGREREYLSTLYDLDPSSEVMSEDVTWCGAAFVYARPAGMTVQKPYALSMLYHLKNLQVPHRLLVRFSDALVTVAIADREHLLLLCSYPIISFTDALYHIFAALRQVMFEPDHTYLHCFGAAAGQNRSLLEQYFEKVIDFNGSSEADF